MSKVPRHALLPRGNAHHIPKQQSQVPWTDTSEALSPDESFPFLSQFFRASVTVRGADQHLPSLQSPVTLPLPPAKEEITCMRY